MQGRLIDKPHRNLQSFPTCSWQQEFYRAKSLGFNSIEWLIDTDEKSHNPIFDNRGRKAITQLSENLNVKVESICLHFFVGYNLQLLQPSSDLFASLQDFLENVFTVSALINIERLVFPLFDQNSLRHWHVQSIIKDLIMPLKGKYQCQLLLETDLPANEINQLFSLQTPFDGIVYDLGNSTALGYDIISELSQLDELIKEIHIKDKKLSDSSTVRLGTGDMRYDLFSNYLASNSSSCTSWVLETPVFADWEQEAKSNITFAKSLLGSQP